MYADPSALDDAARGTRLSLQVCLTRSLYYVNLGFFLQNSGDSMRSIYRLSGLSDLMYGSIITGEALFYSVQPISSASAGPAALPNSSTAVRASRSVLPLEPTSRIIMPVESCWL